MKACDMLNELLDGHGGPLAVLLTVLPFLKGRNIPRRIIQVVVGSVEAFPKDWSKDNKRKRFLDISFASSKHISRKCSEKMILLSYTLFLKNNFQVCSKV